MEMEGDLEKRGESGTSQEDDSADTHSGHPPCWWVGALIRRQVGLAAGLIILIHLEDLVPKYWAVS